MIKDKSVYKRNTFYNIEFIITVKSKYRFKVIFVGPPAVGKTTIIKTAAGQKWKHEYISTIGFNIFTIKREFSQHIIELLIYDLGGQERFRTIHKSFYPGAHVTVFCFDVSEPESLDELPSWKKDRDLYIERPSVYDVLVGNKIDLEMKIPLEKGEEMREKLECDEFILTSAKTGKNIDLLFGKIFNALSTYIREKLS